MASEIEALAVEPEKYAGGGDSVVVEGHYRGEMKSSGNLLNAQFAHVFKIRNGKIVRFQQFTDTKHWAEVSAS